MQKYMLTLAALLLGFSSFAQTDEVNRPTSEVKINILNTIVIGSLELGYEYYIDQNQSLSLEGHFFDRFSYVSGDGKSFDATSVLLAYNYYFVSEDQPSGLYVTPFIKYRGGTFTEIDENDQSVETSLNSFIIGFGGGYKWVHNNKFSLGPYVNIARGFNNDVSERFSAVEVNAGFSVGFKF